MVKDADAAGGVRPPAGRLSGSGPAWIHESTRSPSSGGAETRKEVTSRASPTLRTSAGVRLPAASLVLHPLPRSYVCSNAMYAATSQRSGFETQRRWLRCARVLELIKGSSEVRHHVGVRAHPRPGRAWALGVKRGFRSKGANLRASLPVFSSSPESSLQSALEVVAELPAELGLHLAQLRILLSGEALPILLCLGRLQ